MKKASNLKANQANRLLLAPANVFGGVRLILVLVMIFAIALVGYFIWNKTSDDSVAMIKIVGVMPNYTTIEIPTQECNDQTTSKQVKNPNSGFFSNLFDSKNHPKYIEQKNTKRVCKTVMNESQVINNYVIKYQFKDYIESMLVESPPALNSEMPLAQLQQYQLPESAINLNSSAPQTQANQ